MAGGLDDLFPPPAIVEAGGLRYEVAELAFRASGQYFAAVRPISGMILSGNIPMAVELHPDAVLRVMEVGAGVSPEVGEALKLDAVTRLLNAIVLANSSFFVQRVLPEIVAGREKMIALLGSAAGPLTSPGSPGADTTSPTPPH